MAESSSSSIPALAGLAVETVEWLPSGAESGLVRVRGQWVDEAVRQPELPVLVLVGGGEEHRFDSLPDARFSRDPSSWRGTYLVPAELVVSDPDALWLEWPGGTRSGLPALRRGVEPPPVPGAPERPEPPEETGGQVIDRAVLAERRARRAEAAEQHQARVAAEALKAVEVLELRSAELERRLEEATAERDELAARDSETSDRREALSAALASAADLRARSREWRLHLRTSEVTRAGEAVRLAVMESSVPELREELSARAAELRESRREIEAHADALALAREAAASAREEVNGAESRLAESEARRSELESALASVRDELAVAREEATGAVRALERALATETVARTTLEDELDRERAHRRAVADELTEERAVVADLRIQVESLRTEAGAVTDLRTALTAARAEAASAASQRDVVQADLAAARGELDVAQADAAAAVATARGDLADLRTELEAERAARQAAEDALGEADRAGATLQDRIAELERSGREQLERLAAEQAAARAAQTPAADSTQVVADLDAAAASLRARVPEPAAPDAEPNSEATEWPHASAPAAPAAEPRHAAPAPPAAEPIATAPVSADPAAPDAEPAVEWTAQSDEPAAPDAEPAVEWSDVLEAPEREPVQPAAEPPRTRVDAPDVAWALPTYVRVENLEPPAPDAEPYVEAAPPEPQTVAAPAPEPAVPAPPPPPAGPKIVPASGPPPRALMLGTERRDYPLLRGAIVKLAHDDAALAGRVLAALLPAQGAVIEGPLAYDLTITGTGTYAIAIAAGRATAEPLERPRPRSEAEFHLKADPLVLAELLAGVEHKIGRFFGPARVRGRKRRVKALQPLTTEAPSLTDAATAGAALDPELVYRTFAYAAHPSWTRGHTFTVAQAIVGDPPETWYLTARDGAGLTVSTQAPETPPRATVTMTRDTFDRMLRGDPLPPGTRPVIRGDRHAVELMRAWTERAR